MPALEFHSPDPGLVMRIREGLDRHLDLHARPVPTQPVATLSAQAEACRQQGDAASADAHPLPNPPPHARGRETLSREKDEEARIYQAALDAFFGRESC